MLRSYLQRVKDVRRKQGQRYDLGSILLVSILAILSGAVSYRKIHVFIKVHFELLKAVFAIRWKSVPGYVTIRNILQGVDADSLESVFREYSRELDSKAMEGRRLIACDGKTLKGSFDRFADKRAVQLFSFFNVDSQIILAHEEIEKKRHEIPAFQELIKSLGLSGCILTGDAIHCQKKP